VTLINYLARVHFADDVLEEALSSELETNNLRRPLLVYEQDSVRADFTERVTLGLPLWCNPTPHVISANTLQKNALSNLKQQVLKVDADVLIAFGSLAALSLADNCCRELALQHDSTDEKPFTVPLLFVVPGLDGLPTMSTNAHRHSHRSAGAFSDVGIHPGAVIFDPTLIIGEKIEYKASAVANIIAKCFSTKLSNGYNPPADGIAADGLNRVVRNLPNLITDDTPDMRRELMAASLNGTLASQKETGIAHDLCKYLMRSSRVAVDEGELIRLLIPIEAELMEQALSPKRIAEVRGALGIPEKLALRDWLASVIGGEIEFRAARF